jgi:hypothetical protein
LFTLADVRCSQDGYQAIIVEKETDLTELARDIVHNPVRARMRDRPEDWQWSSDSATTGD